MKLSPIYVERLAEREQIGLEKGVQQGLQQGLQQEAYLLIIRLLKRKLGNLPPNLESQISSLPLKSLEDLGEALLDFNSLDNLIDWLENHST